MRATPGPSASGTLCGASGPWKVPGVNSTTWWSSTSRPMALRYSAGGLAGGAGTGPATGVWGTGARPSGRAETKPVALPSGRSWVWIAAGSPSRAGVTETSNSGTCTARPVTFWIRRATATEVSRPAPGRQDVSTMSVVSAGSPSAISADSPSRSKTAVPPSAVAPRKRPPASPCEPHTTTFAFAGTGNRRLVLTSRPPESRHHWVYSRSPAASRYASRRRSASSRVNDVSPDSRPSRPGILSTLTWERSTWCCGSVMVPSASIRAAESRVIRIGTGCAIGTSSSAAASPVPAACPAVSRNRATSRRSTVNCTSADGPEKTSTARVPLPRWAVSPELWPVVRAGVGS